jgi:hypothetical protein
MIISQGQMAFEAAMEIFEVVKEFHRKEVKDGNKSGQSEDW